MAIQNINSLQSNIDYKFLKNINETYILEALANLGQRMGVDGSNIIYRYLPIKEIITENQVSNIDESVISIYKDIDEEYNYIYASIIDIMNINYSKYNNNYNSNQPIEINNNYSNVILNKNLTPNKLLNTSSIIYNNLSNFIKTYGYIQDMKLTYYLIGERMDNIQYENIDIIKYEYDLNTKTLTSYNKVSFIFQENNINYYILFNLTYLSTKEQYLLDIIPFNTKDLSIDPNTYDIFSKIINKSYWENNNIPTSDLYENINYIISIINNGKSLYNNIDFNLKKFTNIVIDINTNNDVQLQKVEFYVNDTSAQKINKIQNIYQQYNLYLTDYINYVQNDINYLIPNLIQYYSNITYTKDIKTLIISIILDLYNKILEIYNDDDINYGHTNNPLFLIPIENFGFYVYGNDKNMFNIYSSSNIYIHYYNNQYFRNLSKEDKQEILQQKFVCLYDGENKVSVFNFKPLYIDNQIVSINIEKLYTLPFINQTNTWTVNDIDTQILAKSYNNLNNAIYITYDFDNDQITFDSSSHKPVYVYNNSEEDNVFLNKTDSYLINGNEKIKLPSFYTNINNNNLIIGIYKYQNKEYHIYYTIDSNINNNKYSFLIKPLTILVGDEEKLECLYTSDLESSILNKLSHQIFDMNSFKDISIQKELNHNLYRLYLDNKYYSSSSNSSNTNYILSIASEDSSNNQLEISLESIKLNNNSNPFVTINEDIQNILTSSARGVGSIDNQKKMKNKGIDKRIFDIVSETYYYTVDDTRYSVEYINGRVSIVENGTTANHNQYYKEISYDLSKDYVPYNQPLIDFSNVLLNNGTFINKIHILSTLKDQNNYNLYISDYIGNYTNENYGNEFLISSYPYTVNNSKLSLHNTIRLHYQNIVLDAPNITNNGIIWKKLDNNKYIYELPISGKVQDFSNSSYQTYIYENDNGTWIQDQDIPKYIDPTQTYTQTQTQTQTQTSTSSQSLTATPTQGITIPIPEDDYNDVWESNIKVTASKIPYEVDVNKPFIVIKNSDNLEDGVYLNIDFYLSYILPQLFNYKEDFMTYCQNKDLSINIYLNNRLLYTTNTSYYENMQTHKSNKNLFKFRYGKELSYHHSQISFVAPQGIQNLYYWIYYYNEYNLEFNRLKYANMMFGLNNTSSWTSQWEDYYIVNSNNKYITDDNVSLNQRVFLWDKYVNSKNNSLNKIYFNADNPYQTADEKSRNYKYYLAGMIIKVDDYINLENENDFFVSKSRLTLIKESDTRYNIYINTEWIDNNVITSLNELSKGSDILLELRLLKKEIQALKENIGADTDTSSTSEETHYHYFYYGGFDTAQTFNSLYSSTPNGLTKKEVQNTTGNFNNYKLKECNTNLNFYILCESNKKLSSVKLGQLQDDLTSNFLQIKTIKIYNDKEQKEVDYKVYKFTTKRPLEDDITITIN